MQSFASGKLGRSVAIGPLQSKMDRSEFLFLTYIGSLHSALLVFIILKSS